MLYVVKCIHVHACQFYTYVLLVSKCPVCSVKTKMNFSRYSLKFRVKLIFNTVCFVQNIAIS